MMQYLMTALLLFLFAKAAPGQQRLEITQMPGPLKIGHHLEFYEDKSGEETFSEILAKDPGQWQTSKQDIPTFGFSRSRFWLRFELINNSPKATYQYLEAAYSHYDSIVFYIDKGRGFEVTNLGDLKRFSERVIDFRNFLIPMHFEPYDLAKVYISSQTSGPVFFPIQIWNVDEFAAAKAEEDYIAGSYYGILLAMLGYNAFLFFTTKRLFYLYYCLYIAGFALFQMSLHGFSFPLLWPDSPSWANRCVAFFLGLALLWMCVFTRSFLETPKQLPRGNKVINGFIGLSLLVMILSIFVGYAVAVRLGTVLALASGVYLLLCSIHLLRQAYKPAYFYMLAFSMFLFGIITNALKQLGVFPQSFLTEYSIQIGSVLEVLLLSVALGHKIRFEQNAAQQAIQALNQSLAQTIDEVKRLNLELIEKEASRTAFFHNTSHELRTPLNGILGFIQLLLQGRFGTLSNSVADQLAKIQRIAQSFLYQVNAILDLARSHKGHRHVNFSYVDLPKLELELRSLMEGLAYKYSQTSWVLQSSWKFQHPVPTNYIGDSEKILTICRNLIGNAFKFEKEGQTNRVKVSLELTEENSLRIVVEDFGLGISPEQTGKVFDEFYQVQADARRNYEGTGLGLTIVKDFVEAHHGQIEVRSELGIGSKFTAIIPSGTPDQISTERPKSQEETLPAPQVNQDSPTIKDLDQEENTESPQIKQGRILVVDDNPTNCEVLQHILEMDHYQVQVCLSGRAALALLKTGDKPDIILLDLMMPELSGEDVIKALRASPELHSIPVILITARASEDDRIFGLHLGADDYLAKPIIAAELLVRVKNLMKRLELTKAAVGRQMIEISLAQLQNQENREQSPLPESSVSVVHHYQSAEVTGGDWFGVYTNPKNKRIYVLLGDVTGHGTEAALSTLLVSGAVQGSLDILMEISNNLDQTRELGLIAGSLNHVMHGVSRTLEKSMTFCLVCLDRETGEGTYLNAGHQPIFILKPDQKATILFAPGTPLGLTLEPSFGTRKFTLEENEALFLFTDGLIENPGPSGEYLGSRHLGQLLEKYHDPKKLKEIILEKVQVLWRDKLPDDDVAFLIVSRDPNLSPHTKEKAS